MKKILYSALAVSMLAACSQDELVGMQDPNAIAFAGAYIDNATRGNDPSVTATNINTFDVWGYVNNSAGHLFDGVAVNKVDGAWTYSPYATQYWYPNNTYRFFALTSNQAVEGKVSDNVVLNINDPFVNGIGEVKFTNVAGTEDLIFADCPAFQTSADINVKPAPVAFTFDHLLSKVKFTFKNGFATGLTTISVTNVKMEVPNNASITLNAQPAEKGAYTWSDLAGTTVLEFSNMGAGALVNEGVSAESDNERLTFPADANQVYTVTFDVEVFQNGVSVLKRAKTTKIVGCQLLSGNAYNFVAELNQENVSDNPLYPIEFTVENVGEWTDWNENNGGVIPTNAVSTADELAAALAKGGLITLMSDITTTTALQVPANVNATLNLNGKTLEAELKEEGRHHYAIDNYGTLVIKGAGVINARGVENFGKMTIDENVTITNVDTNGGSAIWNEGELVINGGTFKTNNQAGEGSYGSALNTQVGGKAVVNGGTFEAYSQLTYAICNYGETVINDATVKGKHGAVASSTGCITEINGGSFSLMENPGVSDHCVYYVSSIKGGSFTLGNNTDSGAQVFYASTIADGYCAIEKDGVYSVAPAAASASDLAAFLLNGGVVNVSENIDNGTNGFSIQSNVVMNFGGKNVIAGGKSTKNSSFSISGEYDATINDANIAGGSIMAYYGANLVLNNTSLTYNYAQSGRNMVYVASDNDKQAVAVINGGTYDMVGGSGNTYVCAHGNAIVYINGGTFTGKGEGASNAPLNALAIGSYKAQIIISGGTFDFDPSVEYTSVGGKKIPATATIADGYKVVKDGSVWKVVKK